LRQNGIQIHCISRMVGKISSGLGTIADITERGPRRNYYYYSFIMTTATTTTTIEIW